MGRRVSLSPTALNTSMFGDQSAMVGNYLSQQIENMGNYLGNVGNRLYDIMQNSYNYVTDTMNQYLIREELNKNDVKQFNYGYSCIDSFRGLQEANLTMQRYIMAEETIKKMYLNQDLNGYQGSYINNSGDSYGEDDYDWRMVMNGIVQTNEVEDTWSTYEYYQDIQEGDRELNILEQDDILHTWKLAKHIMSTCKYDFTKYDEDPDRLEKMNV